MNYLDTGLKGIINKFADDTKLSGAVESLKSREDLYRDLDKSRGLVNHQLYEVQQGKMSDSAPGMGQPCIYVQTGDEMLESSAMERDLGVMVDCKLNIEESCLTL
ncbi:rna-directed dna polymerase from mobile element jockey-like [Willisornis vidua]|uniref:Rna-directed dna polymerase from mobile element jockey-like n=1 Tax=Willisornis vidua TaxID=1566151 RepID=A0ABQ9D2I7_9PASS|nr:rna-directed dna polymerase from mobile element jockey-like [Willisornis vidua]